MAGLTIGKFAAAQGVSVETVRFYQRRGLLARPERSGGYRRYSDADQWRLAFIRRARTLGFTLTEIADLLGPAEARSTADITRAAEAKLAAITDQIAELAAVQCRLRRLVRVCAGGNQDDCVALHLGEPESAAVITTVIAAPGRAG
ncbi:MAG TPA: MerR family transcriptional regulator [Streptosporangiaceae bacterium]|nr:MerR family transcriptional regulator [Streptosporangiaceae bacterium]